MFIDNTYAFWKGFDTHNTDTEGRVDVKNIICIAFATICFVLCEDYENSKSNITFQNRQKQEEKDIKLETPDGMQEKFDHTLAMLLKNGIIEEVKKGGRSEYRLFETLPQLIKTLFSLRKSDAIEIPDGKENINRFIKYYIKDKNGNSLDDNLRQYRCKSKSNET